MILRPIASSNNSSLNASDINHKGHKGHEGIKISCYGDSYAPKYNPKAHEYAVTLVSFKVNCVAREGALGHVVKNTG